LKHLHSSKQLVRKQVQIASPDSAEGAMPHEQEALRRHLNGHGNQGDAGFVEQEQNGTLQILFEEQGGKFVIAPNPPARQIWVSALAASFKVN
jgi:frataxin-like iron-binding protein CyaY